MPKVSNAKNNVKYLFLTGVLISLIGWIWETVFVFFVYGPNDRGFLTLPLCTIYGFAVILVYVILKTPTDMRIFGKLKFRGSTVLKYVMYFVFSMLIATVIEFITAVFFDKGFDLELWTYDGMGNNFLGYIAPLPSLAWGGAITLFMRFVFTPLFNAVKRIDEKTANILFIVLLVAIIADYAFNYIYLFINGKHFDIPFFDKLYKLVRG